MNPKVWFRDRPFLLELFIILNLGFLAIDIYVAHRVNDFAHPAEWIPFVFSLISPLLLLPVMASRNPKGTYSRPMGLVVGVLAILVGVAGLFYHLESQFFQTMTLASLVYTAPFVAPLAYTGIGFLLLLNRIEDPLDKDWGIWIVFLAAGGFLGNYILSVCDHAQNGFFYWEEWIPVVTSALAVGGLFTFCVRPRERGFTHFCLWLMVIQLCIGVLGFYYHFSANMAKTSPSFQDNFIYGAPIFAPLLFANLALLALLGLFDVHLKNAGPPERV